MKITNRDQFAEVLAQTALRAWFKTGNSASFDDMSKGLNRLAARAVKDKLEDIMFDDKEEDKSNKSNT